MEIFNNIRGEGKGEQCKGYGEQIIIIDPSFKRGS